MRTVLTTSSAVPSQPLTIAMPRHSGNPLGNDHTMSSSDVAKASIGTMGTPGPHRLGSRLIGFGPLRAVVRNPTRDEGLATPPCQRGGVHIRMSSPFLLSALLDNRTTGLVARQRLRRGVQSRAIAGLKPDPLTPATCHVRHKPQEPDVRLGGGAVVPAKDAGLVAGTKRLTSSQRRRPTPFASHRGSAPVRCKTRRNGLCRGRTEP